MARRPRGAPARGDQPCLPGLEISRLDGIFFALRPDPAAGEAIHAASSVLRARHALHGRPLDVGRLHVSLHALGVFEGRPDGLVERAKEVAGALTAPPFEVAFDRVMSFRTGERARPLVLWPGARLAALREFHAALGEAMRTAGLGRHVSKSFLPHVTLLYDRQMVQDQAVAPVRWAVRSFVLVHSLKFRGQHVDMGEWPLREP